MNHKRKKSKRNVRCTLCTDVRWMGNSKGRFKAKDEMEMRDEARLEESAERKRLRSDLDELSREFREELQHIDTGLEKP